MRPHCPARSQPAERDKGRRRGTRRSRIEASHRGEGPRPQRPTGSGSGAAAQRWRSRRDPAGSCRSHSRRVARAAPRWQRSRCRPLGPARPSGGEARPARTAPARGRRCPAAPALLEVLWGSAERGLPVPSPNEGRRRFLYAPVESSPKAPHTLV